MLRDQLKGNIRKEFHWGASAEFQCYQFVDRHINNFHSILDAYAYARVLCKLEIFEDSNIETVTFRHRDQVFFKSIKLKSIEELPEIIFFEHYLYEILKFPHECKVLNPHEYGHHIPRGILVRDNLSKPRWIDRFQGEFSPHSIHLELSEP